MKFLKLTHLQYGLPARPPPARPPSLSLSTSFRTPPRSSFSTLPPTSFLRVVESVERRDGSVGPALFTRLIQKARSSLEIEDIVRESEKRFGRLSWQLLACGAHRAAGKEVDNPTLGASLLTRIEKDARPYVHEGVLRTVLGAASNHRLRMAAQIAFDLLPPSIRTPTDYARLLHSGADPLHDKEHLQQVLSKPPSEQVDIRALGVFLKFSGECHDLPLAQAIWCWGASIRQLSDPRQLGFVTVQYLLLCGRVGDLGLAWRVWGEAVLNGFHHRPEVFGAMLAVLASHGRVSEMEALVSEIPLSLINPFMLTSILTAYSHTGNANGALQFLEKAQKMEKSQGVQLVGLNAYTAVVDAYARKGDFDNALKIIEKMRGEGIEPDVVTWVTVLGPCRFYTALPVAQKVFHTIKTDYPNAEETVAAYVLMVDIYKACGDLDAAQEIHKERISKKLYKERGAVTVTVLGKTYTFFVNEIPAEISKETPKIEAKLAEWRLWLSNEGVSTTSINCRHSEKLALSYAVCMGEKVITLHKNLRICASCHEASKRITKLEDITIRHWDNSRVHIMKDGHCSCHGFY